MIQPPLPFDDICAGRHGGNANSRRAFARTLRTMSAARRTLLLHLRDKGPATRWELSEATGLGYTTVSARCTDCLEVEWIAETGLTRPTRTGSPAGVLMILPAGRAALEARDA